MFIAQSHRPHCLLVSANVLGNIPLNVEAETSATETNKHRWPSYSTLVNDRISFGLLECPRKYFFTSSLLSTFRRQLDGVHRVFVFAGVRERVDRRSKSRGKFACFSKCEQRGLGSQSVRVCEACKVNIVS